MKKRKVFAEGLCFYKILVFFIFGSVFGGFFEEIQLFIKNGVWTCRHDLLIGPFCTLYGFGLVLFLIILGPHNSKRGIFKTFFYSFLIGGIFEYIAGFLSEWLFRIQFWDYSSMFLNIQGRTTIPIMIVWGLLGTLLLKVLYPLGSKWIEKIPIKIGKVVCILFFLFLTFDMVLSYSVFGRFVLRRNGIPPKTFIGEFYDQKFNDEFMHNKYPILKGK